MPFPCPQADALPTPFLAFALGQHALCSLALSVPPCIYKCVFFLSVVSFCSLSFPSVTCTPCNACVVSSPLQRLRCPIPPVSTPLSRLWAVSTLQLLHVSVHAPTGKFLILTAFPSLTSVSEHACFAVPFPRATTSPPPGCVNAPGPYIQS